MADLSKLVMASHKARGACESAPLLVRSYLKPLQDFLVEVVVAIKEVNDEINAAGGCPGNCKKET